MLQLAGLDSALDEGADDDLGMNRTTMLVYPLAAYTQRTSGLPSPPEKRAGIPISNSLEDNLCPFIEFLSSL